MSDSLARFLEAKVEIDARAFHLPTRDRFVRELTRLHRPGQPLTILEPGCGIGTMLESLLALPDLPPCRIEAFDIDGSLVDIARDTLPDRARRCGFREQGKEDGEVVLKRKKVEVRVRVFQADLETMVGETERRGKADALIAHALTDLFPIRDLLPGMLEMLRPGGVLYAPITFDGITALEPPVERGLDAKIMARYHASMQRVGRAGDVHPGGRAGRDLLGAALENGAEVLAAGASDWLVLPVEGHFTGNERAFLETILGYVERTLTAAPDLDTARVQAWLRTRREQVRTGRLVFHAHNLDILLRR